MQPFLMLIRVAFPSRNGPGDFYAIFSAILDSIRCPSGGSLSKPRIAVVDENRNVREGLQSMLQSFGEVQTFASNEAFLQAKNTAAFDCVLVEAGAARPLHLHLLREGVSTPLVCIAAEPSVPDAVEAIKLGAVDYLVQPISDDALHGVLEAALRQSRSGVPDRFFQAEIELDPMLDRMERELIACALVRAKGVVGGRNGAAALLGVTRTGLLYKMKRLGISRAVQDESEDEEAQPEQPSARAASSSTTA
jgi:DNA-binding NtrC family response regulator